MGCEMIDLYVHEINIMEDDQFAPDFLKISPNNKIPAIVDRDTGQTIFESAACLIYLAEKTGKFMPEGAARWPVYEWLMWQMGGCGRGRDQHCGFCDLALGQPL